MTIGTHRPYRPGTTTVLVNFTTDDEAGAVYGALRKLKHDGYTQSFSIYDDGAMIDIPPSSMNHVLDVFTALRNKGFRGISAEAS